jgi:signal transduction histidine kinase
MSTHLIPAQHESRGRIRPAVLIVLVGLVTAALALLAAILAPDGAHAVAAWYAGTAAVLATAAVAGGLFTLTTARELAVATDELGESRERVVRQQNEIQQQQNEIQQLAERSRELEARREEQSDDQHEAVRMAVVALGRAVQASAHRIQEEATRMIERHAADPDVLESGMRVDHAAAQQARHAQSLAVLCGEWPGQQWQEPLPLSDVVTAAAARIIAFKRVNVSGDPDTAVVARAAEPLIHLIAELLANAAQSSPPTTQVLVAIRPVQRGVVVEIDDGGVGLDERRLEQAREIASGRRVVGLADLGQTPQTGLAVVGEYARRHGFRVDLGESVYGGLRAIVLVPAELTEIVEPPERMARREQIDGKPEPSRDKADQGADFGFERPADAQTDIPLPQRRSPRRQDAPAKPAGVRTAERPRDPGPEQTPAEAAKWMGALLDVQPEQKPANGNAASNDKREDA